MNALVYKYEVMLALPFNSIETILAVVGKMILMLYGFNPHNLCDASSTRVFGQF